MQVGGALMTRASTVLSVFIEEKKLSIAALSQTFPERLIEQVMPWSPMRHWNCSLVYPGSPDLNDAAVRPAFLCELP